jgi:hypothetical protein
LSVRRIPEPTTKDIPSESHSRFRGSLQVIADSRHLPLSRVRSQVSGAVSW